MDKSKVMINKLLDLGLLRAQELNFTVSAEGQERLEVLNGVAEDPFRIRKRFLAKQKRKQNRERLRKEQEERERKVQEADELHGARPEKTAAFGEPAGDDEVGHQEAKYLTWYRRISLCGRINHVVLYNLSSCS